MNRGEKMYYSIPVDEKSDPWYRFLLRVDSLGGRVYWKVGESWVYGVELNGNDYEFSEEVADQIDGGIDD